MRYERFTKAKADQIIGLWNKELSESFPLRKKLFYQNTVEDQNLFGDGSYVCLEDYTETVIGFIFIKVWQKEEGYFRSK